MKKALLLIVLLALTLSACGGSETPAPAQAPAESPQPSNTPVLPEPTNTAEPSPTPEPILFFDDFEGGLDPAWNWQNEDPDRWEITADGWLAIQAVVNIGAMTGLLPLKGITLPFISAGGTSLIFVMMALGVVFHISSYTVIRKSTVTPDKERGVRESTHHRWWQRRSHNTATRYRR